MIKKDLPKRIIVPVIIYVVYTLIVFFSLIFDDTYVMALSWVCMAVLIAPLYNIPLKFFYVGNEKVGDYLMSAAIFFVLGLGSCFILPLVGVYIMCMFIIGNCVYAVCSNIIYYTKKRMYRKIQMMLLSSGIGFLLYLSAAIGICFLLNPHNNFFFMSSVSSSLNDNDFGFLLVGLFVIVPITAIFHFISEKVLKVFLEKIQDYIFPLGFFVCVAVILYFAFGSFMDLEMLLISVVIAIFAYIIGNGCFFIIKSIWSGFRKKENRGGDGDLKDEGNRVVDEYWTEGEDLPMGSSEIILIPGIDEDFKEEGSSSDS